ncbi:ferritin [Agrilactobacillus yilanensis]|uniref:Ferritin n=1 Tax=Agrilactobacillus yilanensis TaxID=2485997 RepID=A0ABW4J4R7_9LACO|nr:ferritin [Agrilactobacillus yilanensis]
MKKEVADLLRVQVNKELQSAYIYLDFYNYFAARSLTGFAKWYKQQSEEEVQHAWGFINFLHDMDETVTLTSVELDPKPYKDPLEILKAGLAHEQFISDSIRGIYKEAAANDEYEVQSFLKGFIDEQVEEEKNAKNFIRKYNLAGPDNLYDLDEGLLANKDHE